LVNGGSVLEGMAKGTAFVALAGGVTMGLVAIKIPGALAAAAGGYVSGYAECGEECGENGALYSFGGKVLSNTLTALSPLWSKDVVPAEGTPELKAMQARNDTYATTGRPSSVRGTVSLIYSLLDEGYSHVWHTGDTKYVPSGSGMKLIEQNVPYPGEGYRGGWHFDFLFRNCTTRFYGGRYTHPGEYLSYFNYPGQGAYWW
jgi:hypothetical protein